MTKEVEKMLEEIFLPLSEDEVLRIVGWMLYKHGFELNADTRHRAADLLQAWLSRPDEDCKHPAESARRTFGLCSSATRMMKLRKQSRV